MEPSVRFQGGQAKRAVSLMGAVALMLQSASALAGPWVPFRAPEGLPVLKAYLSPEESMALQEAITVADNWAAGMALAMGMNIQEPMFQEVGRHLDEYPSLSPAVKEDYRAMLADLTAAREAMTALGVTPDAVKELKTQTPSNEQIAAARNYRLALEEARATFDELYEQIKTIPEGVSILRIKEQAEADNQRLYLPEFNAAFAQCLELLTRGRMEGLHVYSRWGLLNSLRNLPPVQQLGEPV